MKIAASLGLALSLIIYAEGNAAARVTSEAPQSIEEVRRSGGARHYSRSRSTTVSRPKHCTKGIPCGNTCISAKKTCHK